MTAIKKDSVSWQEFETDSRKLAEILRTSGEIHGLVCIARGGLVATAIIANTLDIRNVKSMTVVSYHGYQQKPAEVFNAVDDIGDGAGWVFIDDLCETGQTAELLKNRYPKAKIAAPYAKATGKAHIDFFTREVDAETWLDFPWEKIAEKHI